MAEEHHKLPFDDELIDYVSLSKHLKEDTDRKKKRALDEFEAMGERYLEEIEKKKKNKELKQVKLIPFILRHRSDIYSKKELISYCFEDVQNIYDEIKKEKKPFFRKFFHFIFNIE
jgi:hypothetical protein